MPIVQERLIKRKIIVQVCTVCVGGVWEPGAKVEASGWLREWGGRNWSHGGRRRGGRVQDGREGVAAQL